MAPNGRVSEHLQFQDYALRHFEELGWYESSTGRDLPPQAFVRDP